MTDLYKTIASSSKGVYKEKGSKFFAFAYPVFSESDFKEHLNQLKKEYYDARHHCYGFRIGLDDNNFRYSDDGEPNNAAGAPIYGQIQSFGLTNIAVVVVRYFGGTKLGVGGMITAYREAAKDALQNASIIERTIDNFYSLEFGYEIMSDVMNFIKQHQLEVVQQVLEDSGYIEFRIRKSNAEQIVQQLEKINNLKVAFLRTV